MGAKIHARMLFFFSAVALILAISWAWVSTRGEDHLELAAAGEVQRELTVATMFLSAITTTIARILLQQAAKIETLEQRLAKCEERLESEHVS